MGRLESEKKLKLKKFKKIIYDHITRKIKEIIIENIIGYYEYGGGWEKKYKRKKKNIGRGVMCVGVDVKKIIINKKW